MTFALHYSNFGMVVLQDQNIRGNVYNVQSGLSADACCIHYHCWCPMINFVTNRSIFSLFREDSFTSYSFYHVSICKPLFCFPAKDFFPLPVVIFKNLCIIHIDKAKCYSLTYFSVVFTLN